MRLPDGPVLAEQRQEEERRLVAHRGHQRRGAPRVVDGVEPDAGADVLETEPLGGEDGAQGVGPPVGEHAADLRPKRVGVAQGPARREVEQLIVGHRGPQEVGQARGELPIVDPVGIGAGVSPLDAEQELRRDEDRLQHPLDRDLVVEACDPARPVLGKGLVQLAGRGRAPVGAPEEPLEHRLGRVLLGDSPARLGHEDQLPRREVTDIGRLVRQGEFDDPLGRRDVALHQRRLEEQGVRRVVEPARPRQLVGEPVGDVQGDPEQVADGVVVLGVGEPPHQLEAGVVEARVVELLDVAVEHRRHPAPHLRRQRGGAGRRHLALVEGLDDPLPGPAVADERALGDQRRQIDAGGLGLRPVAAEAVLLGEGGDGVGAGAGLGGSGRGRPQCSGKRQRDDTRTAKPVRHRPHPRRPEAGRPTRHRSSAAHYTGSRRFPVTVRGSPRPATKAVASESGCPYAPPRCVCRSRVSSRGGLGPRKRPDAGGTLPQWTYVLRASTRPSPRRSSTSMECEPGSRSGGVVNST